MKIWKEIPGYGGLYRVSQDGSVQSCAVPGGKARGEWRDLSRPLDRAGYELVYLWDKAQPKGKRRIRRLVHQLVAELFVTPRAGPCVNHIDGNKRHNHFSNLEWCTRSDNMRHAWETGLCKPKKITEEIARQILTCGGTDTATAKRFGVSQVWVTKIRAGKAWKQLHQERAA